MVSKVKPTAAKSLILFKTRAGHYSITGHVINTAFYCSSERKLYFDYAVHRVDHMTFSQTILHVSQTNRFPKHFKKLTQEGFIIFLQKLKLESTEILNIFK